MPVKHKINLLQAELYPKKVLLTLNKVVGLWVIMCIVMLSWVLITQLTFNQTVSEHRSLTQLKNQKQTFSEQLQKQLAEKQASPMLLRELESKKQLLARKSALLAKLTGSKQVFSSGFVTTLNDLSTRHNQNITLKTISINDTGIAFTGLAKSPKDVPTWLNGFGKSSLLSGEEFMTFELVQNAQGITNFVVSSTAAEAVSQ